MPLYTSKRIAIKDEGTLQGNVRTVNFVGAGVTSSVSGDEATASISGGGGGGGTFGQVVVDFGTTNCPESVEVNVTDAGVSVASKIIATSVTPNTGRDVDEMEMEKFDVAITEIVASTSFKLLITNLSGGAEGEYLINYTRS